MHILLVHKAVLPVHAYGGTERVVWWLGKALVQLGHTVTFLVRKGSSCPFARVIEWNERQPLAGQIPDEVDVVHLHVPIDEELPRPALTTIHGNSNAPQTFDRNAVFLSHDHATRHGGRVYVYNGLDFDDYGRPETGNRRLYFHFLGNAAWRVKNVIGAIDLAARAGVRLHVIGGHRVNFRMGLRITLSPHVRFHGMIGGDGKNALLQGSQGLIFPVLWHEPFGLAVIESLYFGCPVFGTPFGALPELLGRKPAPDVQRQWNGSIEAFHSEFGCLSTSKAELVEALGEAAGFDRQRCQDYAEAKFSAQRMAHDYLNLYEKVASGQFLHAEKPVCEGPVPVGQWA